jgi:hypothetical protein
MGEAKKVDMSSCSKIDQLYSRHPDYVSQLYYYRWEIFQFDLSYMKVFVYSFLLIFTNFSLKHVFLKNAKIIKILSKMYFNWRILFFLMILTVCVFNSVLELLISRNQKDHEII